MKIERRFTHSDTGPYEGIRFVERTSRIVEPDGRVVFECEGVVVPESWSQVATDVLAQKYFRKAAVPARSSLGEARAYEGKSPARFQGLRKEGRQQKGQRAERSSMQDARTSSKVVHDDDGSAEPRPASATARQVFHRLAGCWTYWGEKVRLLRHAEDAKAFYDEMSYMLASQMAAPNSPQWFNTGLLLGLRHRRAGAGAPLRRSEDGQAQPRRPQCLRAPAAARLLHPERRGRSRQRGRHHGPVDARGAAVQVRLGHRARTSRTSAARERAALRRRTQLAAS